MTYINPTYVAAKLGRELTEDETSYISDFLEPGIAEYISDYIGITYITGEEDEDTTGAVAVNGNGTDTLIVPQLGEITTVSGRSQDGTLEEIDAGDWFSPKPGVVVLYTGRFREGKQNYYVEGDLPMIPRQLAYLVTAIAAAAIYSNGDTTGGKIVSSEKIGDYAVTYEKSSSNNEIGSLGFASPALDEFLSKYKPLRLG